MPVSSSKLICDLHRAARAGELQSFLNLINIETADIISADDRGRTLLHSACETAQLEIIAALLGGQVTVNAQDDEGKTALMIASQNGYYDVVDVLLEEGDASLIIYNELGESAMIFATKNGDVKMMKLLFKYGAQLNDANIMGLTALHIACVNQHRDAVLFLLSEGALINSTDSHGNTALHLSFIARSRCVGVLLACGADTNIVNSQLKTPLELARDFGEELYALLIQLMRKQVLSEAVKGKGHQFLVQLRDQLKRLLRIDDKEGKLKKMYELQVLKDTNALLAENNLKKVMIRSRLLRNMDTETDIENIKKIFT